MNDKDEYALDFDGSDDYIPPLTESTTRPDFFNTKLRQYTIADLIETAERHHMVFPPELLELIETLPNAEETGSYLIPIETNMEALVRASSTLSRWSYRERKENQFVRVGKIDAERLSAFLGNLQKVLGEVFKNFAMPMDAPITIETDFNEVPRITFTVLI